MQQLSTNLFLFEDTCSVYVIRSGSDAVLIDFGAGAVLDHLADIGVERVTDVLMTHHHRDQGQGLPRAVAAGIRIWVPDMEQDLFAAVDAHWQAREIDINYNMRQDRFSLLNSVPVSGILGDYETCVFGAHTFTVVPTPGHTIGSITLMSEIDGQRVAFTGDLIAGPGRVWSMAATQWTYNGAEGAAASIASLLDVKDHQPDLLLPSHGDVMADPPAAIDLLVANLWSLLQLRHQNLRLFELREQPYEAITPHLLRHRLSMANSYVLLSESNKALMFDFGYDFLTGFSTGFDRAAVRPRLYTIPALKRQFGIDKIDVVLPTHFHDDHVAGINLLHRFEGSQVWAAELFADILEHPKHYDLPCLWYDPIPVDRKLPLETPIQWEEYTLTLYALPGHTRYAVAIAVEVDGERVLVTGDQYQGDSGLELNYVYHNRFEAADYRKSAELYRRLNPTIILTGHWTPLHVPPDYFDQIERIGAETERLHHALLDHPLNMGEEGFLVRLSPYQVSIPAAEAFDLQIEIRNPYPSPAAAQVRPVLPEGWSFSTTLGAQPDFIDIRLESLVTFITVRVLTSATRARRTRIAVDLTVNGRPFGQQAEALVTTT